MLGKKWKDSPARRSQYSSGGSFSPLSTWRKNRTIWGAGVGQTVMEAYPYLTE
ncbi:hypothetical protein HPP92_007203 [Vanilla planifolia]|uniref:Uncharacterized protein n=1 Tax=Vanilla planifolia TaxID=51239 RepID=A0A835V7K7_VANPL|nr:hypothetical protein HPP92_007203 [Vanilla planifolia]